MQLLDEVPGRLALGNLLGLLDGACNQADLVADLLGSGVLVDTGNDALGLIQLAVEDELAGRLRAERQEAGKDDGGNTTKADHVPPSVRDMGEGGSDAVENNLATGDGHVVQTDHASTDLGRGDFRNVHGDLKRVSHCSPWMGDHKQYIPPWRPIRHRIQRSNDRQPSGPACRKLPG